MKDAPHLLKPTRHTSGHSPVRHRVADDILAHLTPATAADALSSAEGALRSCLDSATASEREFAFQSALASRKIWEWVEELGDWSWPSDGGSAGFEEPAWRPKKLSIHVTAPEGENERYVGSLSAHQVAAYERRLLQIYAELEELTVEDIKSHVLNNHILPLSRPNSPMSDSNRSRLSSASSYNRMEDLTAVVTAISVQMLPNLARLSQLLQTWKIRITVLHQVPALLEALEDAEVAFTTGWNVIAPMSKNGATSQPTTLTRDNFNVMKMVLSKKVAHSGRIMDYVLDCLEGLPDTLPNQWVDRMTAVEESYSEWIAACERKIRETEWAKMAAVRKASRSELVKRPSSDDAITLPAPTRPGSNEEPSKSKRDSKALSAVDTNSDDDSTAGYDGSIDASQTFNDSQTQAHDFDSSPVDETMDLSQLSLQEEDEPELPPLRNTPRRGSLTSDTSTVVRGASSHFDVLSSDLPEVSASPDIGKTRIREAEYIEVSPPSSPPMAQHEGAESSMMAPASPDIKPSIEDDGLVSAEDSLLEMEDDFDDSVSVITAPYSRRESTGDQQLRQQISEIIEGIPARIRLSTETPAVNLNPPAIQLPQMKRRPSREAFRRSQSAMSNTSTRAGTPSFTLSPARNLRPRHSRGQQEIKVYHLSRSTGEAPIKLFIRCVGENGERVMVRVGGGWADLSEYLKDYATHHGRRSKGPEQAKVEVRDIPRGTPGNSSHIGSSPRSRPASAMDMTPSTPLSVRKTRRSVGAMSDYGRPQAKIPAARRPSDMMASETERDRSSSRLSWVEDDSSFLGLAGPTGRKVEMSEENKAWVESVKEKVRLVSGERKSSAPEDRGRFGELGKVGGTKRLFPKAEDRKR
ncbi:hypothetical protein B0I35DRAFT_409460 [Stachybotrys elegans]|uniref:GAR domain-containing protein n=1 Tax=Stachybotrys elegans TaxID=80388 RepID=A0A8K0WQQ4_9HYPO|nr:hypothetical protein B0I35DRAFT_409460 [Stachybotrys elegans]